MTRKILNRLSLSPCRLTEERQRRLEKRLRARLARLEAR